MILDELSTGLLVTLIAILLLLAAFFSSTEIALMTLNRHKLRHQAEQHNQPAIVAQQLLAQPEQLISLILLCKNTVTIVIVQLSSLWGWRLFGDIGFAIATAVLTLVLLIFADVAPKTLGSLYPEKIALPVVNLYQALLKITGPLLWLVNALVKGVFKLFHAQPFKDNQLALNREELRSVVNAAGATIPKNHIDMLLSVLDLESTSIEDIMVPRAKIYGIDLNSDWSAIEDTLLRSSYTRLLVYRDSVDQVEGFVHLRKILPLLRDGHLTRERLASIIRPAYFVPESVNLTQQLLNFRAEARRIAVVVDEYGQVQGLITMEDILEEIVGEFSTVPLSHTTTMQPKADGSWWVDGSTHLREINRELEINLPTDGAKTMNGLITEHLQALPVPGMTVLIQDHPMEIRKVRNNAVKLVIIYPRLTRTTDAMNGQS